MPKGIPYPGEAVAPVAALYRPEGVPHQASSSSPGQLTVPSSSTPTPLEYSIPILPMAHNFPELIALEEIGEKVLWPAGFTAQLARGYMQDYQDALVIGGLYTLNPQVPITPPEESAPASMPLDVIADSGDPNNPASGVPTELTQDQPPKVGFLDDPDAHFSEDDDP